MTNCGAPTESCCTSLEVPGGTFYRTYSNDGGVVTGKADPATVSAFRLDKYEVTVGRFRQFVLAWNDGYTPAPGAGKHTHLNGGKGLVNANEGARDGGGQAYEPGWFALDDEEARPMVIDLDMDCASPSTWTHSPGSRESLPIDCVNWWEAFAFCAWDGGFLPSDAEWQYAAAGGSEQRLYPWGDADPGTGNEYAIYDCNYGKTRKDSCSGVDHLAPVGTRTRGAGRWGQLDLAGNVAERTLDTCERYPDPCVDCVYQDPLSNVWALRGGDAFAHAGSLLPRWRYCSSRTGRTQNFGFRCARAP
jgi:sulfatase modifying factor 1